MDPATILAGASGGANILQGLLGYSTAKSQAKAARDAAQLQYQAAQDAIAEQRRQYDVTRGDLAGYMGAGQRATDRYTSDLFGGAYDAPQWQGVNMAQDPGVQYRLDQAQKAIQASAAARGGLLGGGTMRAINKEAQGLASQEYGNAYNRASQDYARQYGATQDKANRFQGLMASGQNAAAGLGGIGQNTAGQIGLLGTQGANAMAGGMNQAAQFRAQGLMGLGDSFGSGLEDITTLYGMRNTFKNGNLGGRLP